MSTNRLRTRRQAAAGRWLEGDGAALKVPGRLYAVKKAGLVCRCCGRAFDQDGYVGHPCAGTWVPRVIEGGRQG